MAETADTDAFVAEMGENPLGRRIGLRAVGPFIIERYTDLLLARNRRRNGDPEQQRIQVYCTADGDHWRGYEQIGEYKSETDKIADAWDRLTDTDAVTEWVDAHPADDD